MQNYSNKDFYLASFLVSAGCPLLETKVNDNTTTFIFESSDELNKFVNQYYSLKARVEPMTYGQAIRTLKSIIHSSKINSNSKDKTNVFTNKKERITA